MSKSEKKVAKWKEDWTKVIQIKRIHSEGHSRKTGRTSKVDRITISVAKPYNDQATEILKTLGEILKALSERERY